MRARKIYWAALAFSGFGWLLMAATGGYPYFPTFGLVTVNAAANTTAMQLNQNSAGNGTVLTLQGNAVAGASYGEIILAGTNSSDAPLRIFNNSGSSLFWTWAGDGGEFYNALADKGAGTINAQGLYVNGAILSPPQTVTLSVGSSKTSNTTVAVDATLKLAVASAGTYKVELYGPAQTGLLTGQGGIQLTFGLSAANNTYTQVATCIEVPADGTPSVVQAGTIVSSPSGTSMCFLSAAAFSSAPTIAMSGVVTLSAATTIGVWWAQASSNAAATTLNAGTTLVVTRIL